MSVEIREMLSVVWLAPATRPLSRGRFTFNRLLAWLLYYKNRLHFRQGKLNSLNSGRTPNSTGSSNFTARAPPIPTRSRSMTSWFVIAESLLP